MGTVVVHSQTKMNAKSLLVFALVIMAMVMMAAAGPRDANHRLGANKCTWGPSYWCSSFENADECGARAHCESVGWRLLKRFKFSGLVKLFYSICLCYQHVNGFASAVFNIQPTLPKNFSFRKYTSFTCLKIK